MEDLISFDSQIPAQKIDSFRKKNNISNPYKEPTSSDAEDFFERGSNNGSDILG